jgi:hypothetical protein
MTLIISIILIFVAAVYIMAASGANIMMILKYGPNWRDGE